MNLADIIEEKRFLGQEFLTWLWWKSEERGGSVLLEDVGDILVVFEKHLLLESGEGETLEKIICSGLRAELFEARTGLQMGKKLEQARIRLTKGDLEWNFTLSGALMEFRNVKLPKTEGTEGDKGNPEETEGMILERIYLHEELMKTVFDLFKQFITLRLSEDWTSELVKMKNWVANKDEI